MHFAAWQALVVLTFIMVPPSTKSIDSTITNMTFMFSYRWVPSAHVGACDGCPEGNRPYQEDSKNMQSA